RHELFDLPLAVGDEAHGHRLHPARAEPRLHLVPEERAELVAHDAVQHPAGLIRVHQVRSLGRGDFSAALTASAAISWNWMRWAWAGLSFSASARCQEMAAPSRSGSVASSTRSAVLALSRNSFKILPLPRIVIYRGSK